MALVRQQRLARIAPPALIDPLTGLATRHAFLERLERALARARRRQRRLAVMLLDIDRFAAINREFGITAGDSLLRLIGGRLRRCLRETDTVARLLADRFALVLEDLGGPEQLGAIAAKLRAAVTSPVTLAGESVAVGTRPGAALCPDDAADAAGVLAAAAGALAAAPRGKAARPRAAGGQGRHASRGAGTPDGSALAIEELNLLFQPQVTLLSRELGLATLVEWQRRPHEALAGDALRALAEGAGLIELATDWLLEAACRQAARWRAAGLPRLHVAVPLLARRQLGWSDLDGRLERHLAATGIAPAECEIEIDEPLLLEDRDAAERVLGTLRERGLRVAVAGYGRGTTSLTLLRDLPLTTVKLAPELLHGVPGDGRRTAAASAAIRAAGELQLRVVADGVETQAQLQLLRQLGCHAVQALICCPPLPADACAGWLRQAARRG